MKELDFINIIKTISCSKYIGDDCAYLKDLGIVVTQDNFVEDVHFKREWVTPFQLGYKATVVNISDILASGAKPAYITVGLSIPQNTDEAFIKEFYKGVNKGVNEGLNGAKVIGGDITSSDKIFVSITAIGLTKNINISSRSFAKPDYVVITNGNFGTSSYGLKCLSKKAPFNEIAVKQHLEPKLDISFSKELAEQKGFKYAMMDTSDGLFDTLYKIADLSGVTIKTSLNDIPHFDFVKDKKDILFGGEDYNLVAAVPQKALKKLSNYNIIGTVTERKNNVKLIIDDNEYSEYDEINIYNHFGD